MNGEQGDGAVRDDRSEAAPTCARAAGKADQRWLANWFPVAFGVDIAPGALSSVSVFDTRYVVYRDSAGVVRAAFDRCPHRGARLSNGRLVEGEVECLYHGWRFAADGKCRHIPQLDAATAIPPRAALSTVPALEREAIIWIWPGDPEEALPELIPAVPQSMGADSHRIDFAIDLPYGQDFLIENVIDLAHIHVAHDGVRGGGRRAFAGPLRCRVEERGAAGFHARFEKSRTTADTGSDLVGAEVEYRAPNLVHYVSNFADPGARAGLALYSLPLAAGRSRLLYRAYGNQWPVEDLSRPRWREHLHQCRLLEQDMALVAGQAIDIDRSREPLSESWLPIRTSDHLVLAFRRWIDVHAIGRPGSVGFEHVGARGVIATTASLDRERAHVRQCVDCSRALARVRAAHERFTVAVLVGVLLTALSPLPWAVLPALGALAAAYAARRAAHWSRELTREVTLA